MIGKLFKFLGSFLTWRTLALYILLSILPALYVKLFSKKLRGTPELNKKYAAFARTDYPKWGFWRFALSNIFMLAVPRYLVAWSMCLLVAFQITFLKFVARHKKGEIVSRRLDWWFRTALKYPARLHSLCCGVSSIR